MKVPCFVYPSVNVKPFIFGPRAESRATHILAALNGGVWVTDTACWLQSTSLFVPHLYLVCDCAIVVLN